MLSVLYEDNHLLAINKPSGTMVQGDATGDTPLVDICKDYIKEKHKKPGDVFLGVVHRLDRPVTGVVVFAGTSNIPPPKKTHRGTHLYFIHRLYDLQRTRAVLYQNNSTASLKQTVGLTHSVYELVVTLPESKKKRRILLGLDENHASLKG